MSKVRHFLSLIAITGLLILAGGVGIWSFPLPASPQATAVTWAGRKGKSSYNIRCHLRLSWSIRIF